MKIVLFVVAALVLAISIVADYKWRRWMASRREQRQRDNEHPLQ